MLLYSEPSFTFIEPGVPDAEVIPAVKLIEPARPVLELSLTLHLLLIYHQHFHL